MRRLFLIFTFLIFVSIHNADARHIIGGEINYTCKSIDATSVTMSVELILYRDSQSGGADYDDFARIGIYSGSDDNWDFVSSTEAPLIESFALEEASGTPCLSSVPDLASEKGVYKFDVNLPFRNDSYLISYTRCCRVEGINNIVNSDENGARYYIEITPEAQRACDSSPKFLNLPPSVICANYNLDFDVEIEDKDNGHRIEYELCAPSAGGGRVGSNQYPGDANACDGITPDPQKCGRLIKDLPFKSGYSFDDPIKGKEKIQINRNTGKLTGFPEVQGVYAMAVCAVSYDENNVRLTTLKRDFQVFVTECKKEIFASVKDQVDLNKIFDITSCTGDKVQLINGRLSNELLVDEYEWEIFLKDGTVIKSNDIDPVFDFEDTGNYLGKLFVNRNSKFEHCKDSTDFNLSVYPSVQADFDIFSDLCKYETVNLQDKSIVEDNTIEFRNWVVNGSGLSDEASFDYLFPRAGLQTITLQVEDNNGCTSEITKELSYYPIPTDLEIDFELGNVCIPVDQEFKLNSELINEDYQVTWTVDGKTYNELNPVITLNNSGSIDVQVQVKSPDENCGPVVKNSTVDLLVSPTPGFKTSPNYPTQFTNEVQITSTASDTDTYEYSIKKVGSFNEPDPYVVFQDTGYHEIKQVVFNANGCKDSLIKKIDIIPMTTFYMPNAFTPNGDGENDTFKGKGFTSNIAKFEMLIFNRWGEMVFETSDPEEGWDGNLPGGDSAPQEAFSYKIYYRDTRGKENKLRGSFLLIR